MGTYNVSVYVIYTFFLLIRDSIIENLQRSKRSISTQTDTPIKSSASFLKKRSSASYSELGAAEKKFLNANFYGPR